MEESEEMILNYLDTILLTMLYRSSCPPTMALANLDADLIEDEEEIRVHLAHCPHCQAEWARLQAFMAVDGG